MTEVTNKSFPEVSGTYIIIQDDYAIKVNTGTHLILVVGYTSAKDPMIAWPKKEKKFEFKHSSPRKHWTSEMGVEYEFKIARSKIHIVKENGYSYPKIMIKDKIIQLNTSGGTSDKYWVDMIGYKDDSSVRTGINMPLNILKVIVDEAEK